MASNDWFAEAATMEFARTSVTSATRGSARRMAASLLENPCWLVVSVTRSCAFTDPAMADSPEALNDAAMTATAAISATPIISAAAVDAVRRGLRIAFSLASRPGTPRRRASGRPRAPATGRTSSGAR